MMKFVGNLWAFMFKTKNLASVSHCARKLQCRKNTIDEIATPKKTPKDIILELIAADAGANRGGHWEILPQ